MKKNFVEELRWKTGEDQEVADYVLDREVARGFLERLFGLIEFLLPQYEAEGKAYLRIGIGCTGGRHRSVAIAAELVNWLEEKEYRAKLVHRDHQKASRHA